MPRLTSIRTGKGDDGSTALTGGRRVAKDSPRVAAYGAVDELNSVLGLVRSEAPTPRVQAILERIQNDCFIWGTCRLPRTRSQDGLCRGSSPGTSIALRWRSMRSCRRLAR
jgi:cob(I)alamin adenosyltransferase